MSKTFTAGGEEYELLDDDDLSLNEMVIVERVTGLRFSDPEAPKSMEFIKGLVWISMKRKTPTIAYDDAGDLVSAKTLLALVDDDEDEAPKDEGTTVGPEGDTQASESDAEAT